MNKPLSLILASLLLSFASCGEKVDQAQARKDSGTVIIAIDTAPESLDPRVGTSQSSYRLQQLLYNRLISQGLDGRLEPDLARSWIMTETENGIEWVFSLQPDVQFHDGTTLSAKDVAFTFNSMLEEDFISRKKGAFTSLKSVEVVDDLTVKFTLSERQHSFLSNMPAIGIISAQCKDIGFTPLGTGPFKLSKQSNQQIDLVAHSEFFAGKPGISNLVVKVILDDTTRSLELLHGSVDIVINDLSVIDAWYLSEKEKFKLIKSPGLPYTYLGFNHEHPILSNTQVRQAIALSINRQLIIDKLYGGLARLAENPMVPSLWPISTIFEDWAYAPETARELLDQAGYPDPDGDGPEKRFYLEFKSSSQRKSRDLATVIKQQLADVGIGVEVKSSEWQTFYMDIVNGNFSLYSLRWIGIIDPDFFGALFHSTSIPGLEVPEGTKIRGSLNRGRYRNTQMDALIESAEQELDEGKRWEIYKEIADLLYEDLPYVNLWYMDNFAVVRSDLEGIELSLNASFARLYKLHYK